MKPLLQNDLKALLSRIDNAINGELVSVVMNDPQSFTIELSVQDKNRGFDWINIAFEMTGVIDARLVDENKVPHINMDEGISILFENGVYGIGIGSYKNIVALKSAPLYLLGSSLKYEERPFS